jgi:hypothetical protein
MVDAHQVTLLFPDKSQELLDHSQEYGVVLLMDSQVRDVHYLA